MDRGIDGWREGLMYRMDARTLQETEKGMFWQITYTQCLRLSL